MHISQVTCDQYFFCNFIHSILQDIKTHPVPGDFDDSCYLLWDNLKSHKTAYITNMIEDRQSTNHLYLVNRLSYWPKIAPIEYDLCEITSELGKWVRRDWDLNILRDNIYDICRNIGTNGCFHSTFFLFLMKIHTGLDLYHYKS